MAKRIKIGTRGSPLALAQASEVKARLLRAHPDLEEADITLVAIKTSGDTIQDRQLIEEGGKGLFTKEIEEQLLSGGVDLAVHSTKDMPAELPDGLELAAFLEREDPRDAFISDTCPDLNSLPKGAIVGTSSLRRQAQTLAIRPDLRVMPIRGNVETRLKKMAAGEFAATFLAVAGLNRLGLENAITAAIPSQDFLPAPGQGAICLETREDNEDINTLIAAINHSATATAITVERAISKALGASCRMPLGALATLDGETISASVGLFSPDGRNVWKESGKAPSSKAVELGQKLGETIKNMADPDLLMEFGV